MEAIHIRRMKAHYRLPRHGLSLRGRLDCIFESMSRDWLAVALDRLGIDSDEVICIRSIANRAHLKLAGSDDEIAAAWALHLATAIKAAIEDPAAGVIRYRSRAAAIEDLVLRLLRNDWGRAWAWRQIGILSTFESPSNVGEGITAALVANPELLLPILINILHRNSSAMVQLASVLTPSHWQALAEAAWRAATGQSALTPLTGGNNSVAEAERLAEAEQNILHRSHIAMQWISLQHVPIAPAAMPDARVTYAIALLSWLEAGSTSCIAATKQATALAAAIVSGDVLEEIDDISNSPTQQPNWNSISSPDVIESRFGGLLLLIRLFLELDLYSSLAEALPNRPLAWALSRIAMRLASVESDDPALLVFAGVHPLTLSPMLDEAIATPAEAEVIDHFAARIECELDSCLGAELELQGPLLLHFLLHRGCRIEADPGWVRVIFSLSDVSTAIRRIGLDLDPGYIRQLGITVVFRYE